MALKRANIDYENVGISEVDKYAIIAYDAVHGKDCIIPDWSFEKKKAWLESRNIGFDYKKKRNTLRDSEVEPLFKACVRIKNHGDISLINPKQLGEIDLFTYSFPCQDISLAGKGKGLTKGSGTRSGLLWECEKIISYCKPRFLLMENVKNLVGKKFKPDFDEWCKELEDLGYTNYWQVMNAKDYGVPQNRERVFMVSILGGGEFEFPKKEVLRLRLKDVLEDYVDERYYLRKEVCDRFTSFPENRMKSDEIEILGTTAPNPRDSKGNLVFDKNTRNWVNGIRGIVGALSATDYKQPKQIIVDDKYYLSKKLIKGFEERNKANREKNNGFLWIPKNLEKDSCANALTAHLGFSATDNSIVKNSGDLINKKIRKLTPLECFRLMGVTDDDFYKIKKALNETFYKGKDKSNSQLYKLAGNSIVVQCMEKIFKNLKV